MSLNFLIIILSLLPVAIASAGKPRIVSLAPLVTAQVILLGEADRLAGITAYCPPLPEGSSAQVIGNIVELNHERILLLKPDLVLASVINSRSGLDRLEKLGLTVRVIPEGTDFESICGSFLEMSRLIGRLGYGKNLVLNWKAEAKKFRPARSRGRNVFVVVGSKPLITAGRSSFISSALSFAGAENTVRKKEAWIRYNPEEALKIRPDLVLLVLPESAAKEERIFWEKKGLRTATVDPDLFGLATPPRFLESARIVRDLLDRMPAR